MKQHIELPSEKENSELTPKDKLIYLALKSFENGETHDCFPSLAKISERCGASEPTIRKSLKLLESEGYIKIEDINKRKKRYTFSPYKKFECFSYDFLYNNDLTFTEKSYLAASQEFMLNKESGKGEIDYSSYELSTKINMPPSTIRKCENSLQSKNYMEIVYKAKDDLIRNNHKGTKYYLFAEYNKAVCEAIITHENRLNTVEERIDNLEKRYEDKCKEAETYKQAYLGLADKIQEENKIILK